MERDCETLYDLYTEIVNKRKTLMEIREETQALKLRKYYNSLKQKTDTLTASLNMILVAQAKINNKKAATIMKLQRDSSSTFDKENILLLPQTYHKDLKNIVTSEEKIENLLSTAHISNNYEIIEKAVNDIETISNAWNRQLVKDIHLFRSGKGLYKNVLLMKELNSDESILSQEFETESDLGCYPYDSHSTPVNRSNSFITSSPIYNINKPRILVRSSAQEGTNSPQEQELNSPQE